MNNGQQPVQYQVPTGYSGTGDVLNVQQRSMDAELQKHVLDIAPLHLAFNKVFSGWMEVTYLDEITLFGRTKMKERHTIEVDRYSRVMNEFGSNYASNAIAPLIMPVTSTSHVRPIDIYNHWHGGLLTIRSALLESYHIRSFICTDDPVMFDVNDEIPGIVRRNSCTFITSNEVKLRQHQRKYGHVKYIEVINPYEINIERWAEIVTKLANCAIITMKAKEGFTMKEFAEMYVSTNMMRNGIPMQMPQQQQQGGWLSGIARGLGYAQRQ